MKHYNRGRWSQLLNTNLKIQYPFVRPYYAFHFGLWFPLPETGNVITCDSSGTTSRYPDTCVI